jgi:hypothetical protein
MQNAASVEHWDCSSQPLYLRAGIAGVNPSRVMGVSLLNVVCRQVEVSAWG